MPDTTSTAPQPSPTEAANAAMTSVVTPQSAPAPQSDEAKQQATREEAMTDNLLGVKPDSVKNADEMSRGYIDAANKPRDASGRFTSDKTEPNADYAPDAETDPEPEATEGDEEGGKTETAAGEADDTGIAVMAALGIDPKHHNDKGLNALVKEAERIAGLSTEGRVAPAPVGGEAGGSKTDPRPAPSASKEAPKTDADDDDLRTYSAAEIAEAEEQEGKLAAATMRSHNFQVRQYREQQAARSQQPQQNAEAANAREMDTLARNVVLPAFWNQVKQVPALEAVYGKPDRGLENLTDAQIGSMKKVIDVAKDLHQKSAFDPSRTRPMEFAEALNLAIAKQHHKDIAEAMRVKERTNAVIVKRHGMKTLSPSGTSRSTRDPVKELNQMAGSYLAQRK